MTHRPFDDEVVRALAGAHLPSWLERWRLTLAPGAEHLTDGAEWAGAMVLVEAGQLEVDCRTQGASHVPPQ